MYEEVSASDLNTQGKNAWNQVVILQRIFKSSEKSLRDLT